MEHTIIFNEDPSSIVLNLLEVQAIESNQHKQFDALLNAEHYLGESPQIGDMLRQVITFRGEWVAILLWGPCAYHLKDRDEWIGWDAYCAKERRKLIVQNRRFLVLGNARKPNLASKSLALALKHLPIAWEEKYGYRPVLAETFTDPEQFEGTCYKANGWEPLGFTQGYKRHRAEYYVDINHPKKLWIKLLHNQGRYFLHCKEEHVPNFCRKGLVKDSPDRSLPLKVEQLKSLKQHLARMEDPRRFNSIYKLSSLLSLVTIGLMCGHTTIAQIQRMSQFLTQKQRGLIGFPRKKTNAKFHLAPSYSAIYNLLKQINPDALASHLNLWTEAQMGTLPKSLGIDGKSIGDRVHTLSLIDHESGAPVLVTTYGGRGHEQEAGKKIIELASDLSNTVITADALHCQKKHSTQ
jgi:Domain of unknown function (DUF4338)/DDE_Tnp_1-associated